MNILFVLYHDMTCNSASHVDGVARELCGMGCDCLVAAPGALAGIHRFQPLPYRTATFDEVLHDPRLFGDGRGPDLVHVWNPREVNRKFCARLAEQVPFRTVVHLEDNEEHIARTAVGEEAYARAAADPAWPDFPDSLSHPRRSREFLESADGATVLVEALGEKVPPRTPRVVFWPAVDRRVFHPRPRNDALRHELGIPPDTCVLTYHGNMHSANHAEVRGLYLAVALLRQSGVPARLLRVGSDYVPLTEEYRRWAAEFTVDFGYVVNRRRLTDILAAADVFVQPGTSDPFNDYRFPSKLPEFFAMGRPVVLPRANIGLVTRHLVDAYVLDEANGVAIAEAVARIARDADLAARLVRGARDFDAEHFSWRKSACALRDFYDRLAAGAADVCRAA